MYLATLINFVIIGAWHGANWTFVLFGVYHGLLLVLVLALDKRRKKFEKKHNLKKNELYKWTRRILTFVLCVVGAVLWRANSVGDFFGTMAQLGSGFGPIYSQDAIPVFLLGGISMVFLFIKEYVDEYDKKLHFLHSQHVYIRILSFALLAAYIVFMGELSGGMFIYFQF